MHVASTSPRKSRSALQRAFGLTVVFLLVEALGGWLTGSLALMADAGHMLTDATALGLSLLASRWATRPVDERRTYGQARWEVVAAFFNGVFLLGLVALILHQAVTRLLAPTPVQALPMLGVALAGLAVNLAAAKILHEVEDPGLNVRAALLHVMADLLGSLGAVVAAALMILTGFAIFDPILSILIGVLILYSSGNLVRESLHVLIEGVPSHLSVGEVRSALMEIGPVREVHDLHLWTITSGYVALSAHLVVPPTDASRLLEEAGRMLHRRFRITHSTLQIEPPDFTCCEPCDGEAGRAVA